MINKSLSVRDLEMDGYSTPQCGSVVSRTRKSSTANSITEYVTPLNTFGLRPVRHWTRYAIVTILDTGEVCLEFFRSHSGGDGHSKTSGDGPEIVQVYRISPDGMQILVYCPSRDAPVTDTPLPPANTCHKYGYYTLPKKHWKKYMYAVRFISVVKSKTPRVTYFSPHAKCMLMESGNDSEFIFYEGIKFTISKDTVKVTDCYGTNITMETESDCKLLSSEMMDMWEHVKECKEHCQTIERVLYPVHGSGSSNFPVIIGSRYSSRLISNPTQNSAAHSIQSSVEHCVDDCIQRLSPIANKTADMTDGSESVFTSPVTDSRIECLSSITSSHNSSHIVHKCYVDNIGWAHQLRNGTLWIYFDDGTRLALNSDNTEIKFVHRAGNVDRYHENETLPLTVQTKLECLPSILSALGSS